MLEPDAVHRVKNYVLGSVGVTMSLADLTGYLQFIAALAGAILVCRQLWRDYKREKRKDGKNTKS